MTMTFQWEDRKVVLHGDPNLCVEAISPSQFHKLMAHNNVSSCFMRLYVVPEKVTNISEQVTSEVQPLLNEFVDIFKDLTQLPPVRSFGHRI
ncbi:hypothetical protein Pint_07330 [Pistacia integerrima]|uniref:Uncharacterized protein n=1 Tax=Pistacia integerrima TaxID=434235 RepID=A0ACC0XVY9_9ROSI|nr:hypothetical protein Pint_07330 [Pistacia integerrima]